MKRLTVIISPTALAQIEAQMSYIANRSVQHALAWEARLQRAILALADTHGYAIDESATERLGYPVRKMVFERTYLIHFTIDDESATVRVVNFRHGARLPKRGEP